MSDRKEGVRLSSLGLTPEAYQTLWKSYGSRENWEEIKRMRKQLAGQEKEIEGLREQLAELTLENAVLLREFTKDRIN